MQNSNNGKNFLGKNLQNFAGSGNIYDFTYHKLIHMMDQLLNWDPADPEILVLNNILELYIDGDVNVHWTEGFPMPYPADAYASIDELEDDLYDELEDMGLIGED
jgi:hypothetical protein